MCPSGRCHVCAPRVRRGEHQLKKNVTTRDALDPGGKAVDIYEHKGLLRTFVLRLSPDTTKEKLVPRLLVACGRIKKSGDSRIRNREFVVYGGYFMNSAGRALFLIHIPYGISSHIFDAFDAVLRPLPEFDEIHYGEAADYAPEPWIRYTRTSLLVYVDPFRSALDLPDWLKRFRGSVELRSAEVTTSRNPEKRSARVPQVRGAAPERHTFEEWCRNRNRILEFCWGLTGPLKYATLKRITKNQFGIPVFEEKTAFRGYYGAIRLDPDLSGWACHPRILVDDDLEDELKYVVLAHELGHYVCHMEFLQTRNLVERMSWNRAGIGEEFTSLIATRYPNLLQMLEDDADDFASHFLIPPKYNGISKMAERMWEGTRAPIPEELIWRFLLPHFPESAHRKLGWVGYEGAVRDALDDIANLGVERSLFFNVFRACCRVESGLASRELVRNELSAFLTEIAKLVNGKSNPANRAASEQGQLPLNRPDDRIHGDSLAHLDLLASAAEILPPLRPDALSGFKVVPLKPAPSNLEGDLDGAWYVLISGEASAVRSVAEWRALWPFDGTALYHREDWQKRLGRES